ncbi:hypothetical protein [Pararobbsia silviterrae]|uniref:Phospholipid:lipid A palmitoyltransferase n=1 Tax=Pararobbsia silviterrae TaxID=1792498 RepID=A0A494XHX7_9BURK|nr:hypothetical protein [Pararobbsia silviterrae]RKP47769.1 hypothetical protein D7S86_22695 [Pararobbsia silviterrae]
MKKASRGLRGAAVKAWACAAIALGGSSVAGSAQAADWCGGGLWLDGMVAAYHINPKEHFNDFNPGLGLECWVNNNWAVTGGEFRNSLDRPSWYGGGIWSPDLLTWGYARIAVMGGIISGYNYGNWGLGRNHTIGPVVAPILMTHYGKVGINFILVPPIHSDNLPATVGFMLRYRF